LVSGGCTKIAIQEQRSTDAHGKGYYRRRVPGHARGLSQHWHSDGRRGHGNTGLFRVEHDGMHSEYMCEAFR